MTTLVASRTGSWLPGTAQPDRGQVCVVMTIMALIRLLVVYSAP